MMHDMDKMIASLLEALTFSPNNVRLKKHVAELLQQAGRNEEALQQWREVFQQTEDPESQVNMGKIYYNLGDFIQAREVLTPTLSSHPTAEIYLLLSKICFSLDEYQQAGDYYLQAAERDAGLEDAEYQQKLVSKGAKLRLKLSNVDYDESVVQDDAVERPNITFKDVGGLEQLKENIRMNIIYPFQNPALFKTFGKKIGGGILLYGPPGCGKTYLARATAGECNARFINIAINDILDMYIGNSEKNLHAIFELARKQTPAIIFIDELDALGGSRQQMRFQHNRMLTNQLLNELDGVEADNSEILVLGATNSPWFVDSSLRRPGRFDRVLFVPPPDPQARAEILQLHLKGKPAEELDAAKIVRGMEKFSGADIKAVCDAAADIAITNAMKTGKIRPIRAEDIMTALKQIKPSTLEWLQTAKNYATYSNAGGTYDDILDYFQKYK